jgi:hypothetical protein
MDRRSALKKIAAGGAAAAGASLIVSTPVIADGGSNSARPAVPTPTFSATGTVATSTITWTFPPSTCPTGNPASGAVRQYRLARQGGGSTTGTVLSGLGDVWGPTSGSETRTVTWNPTGPATQTIRIRTRVRYTCRDFNGSSPAWRCATFVRVFTRDPAGVVTVSTPVADVIGQNGPFCNSPGPA